jgi:hypothetical protein
MKFRFTFFTITACLGILVGYLWGYHDGDKHAACWHSDLESFQMQEIPAPGTDPFPKGPDIERGDPL